MLLILNNFAKKRFEVVDDDRRLTYERTQCRAALSEKDVKLSQLKQQLITANIQSQQAAEEVRSVAVLYKVCLGQRKQNLLIVYIYLLHHRAAPTKYDNQSINQSLFANAITSKQQTKKCGRLPEQAIAQQSWPP